MLDIKCKFKAGADDLKLFDTEAEEGKHSKLVRVDFGETICFYSVNLLGNTPTESEQSSIIDEVEGMFNEALHYWHTTKTLDCPLEAEFKTNNVYCFNIG